MALSRVETREFASRPQPSMAWIPCRSRKRSGPHIMPGEKEAGAKSDPSRKVRVVSKLHITVSRNPNNTYALLHQPLVMLDNGQHFVSELRAYELLNQLKREGLSDEEIMTAQREIEERG